jgi:hypothetical protein
MQEHNGSSNSLHVTTVRSIGIFTIPGNHSTGINKSKAVLALGGWGKYPLALVVGGGLQGPCQVCPLHKACHIPRPNLSFVTKGLNLNFCQYISTQSMMRPYGGQMTGCIEHERRPNVI